MILENPLVMGFFLGVSREISGFAVFYRFWVLLVK